MSFIFLNPLLLLNVLMSTKYILTIIKVFNSEALPCSIPNITCQNCSKANQRKNDKLGYKKIFSDFMIQSSMVW